MIIKEGNSYFVKSESRGKDGKHKNLGGPYKTHKQAAKRLDQVEYFKHKG